MIDSIEHPLGTLLPEQFLARYWQREPLLIRQGWLRFQSPLEPEELAGLACEEEVESRLVSRDAGEWRVEYGPFDEKRFAQLPEHDWTLLVTDVEKHLPELRQIIEPFRFIPDWRIDDLMISYATTGGSVGPHIDAYDVFLLQGMGRRRWQIQLQPDTELLADEELKLLRHFQPDQEWLLEPGDLLYLPPGVAHWGVAEEPCMTYSIGFRAPAYSDLIQDLTAELVRRSGEERYRDPGLRRQDNPGEIPSEALQRLRHELLTRLIRDKAWLERWLAAQLTQPKRLWELDAITIDLDNLKRYLDQGWPILCAPSCRMGYRVERGRVEFYADGVSYDLDAANQRWIGTLCRQREIRFAEIDIDVRDEALTLLQQLLAAGSLALEEDEE